MITLTDDTEFYQILKEVIKETPKTSSKRFFNQLFGGRHSKSVIGDLLAVLLNNSMATYKISGIQTLIEKQILEEVRKKIKYPSEYGGTFPTGGSMSNFMTLVAARDKISNHRLDGESKKDSSFTVQKQHTIQLKKMFLFQELELTILDLFLLIIMEK